MFSTGLLFTFSLISLSIQQEQHDPLKDFCRLFGHQTAVVDRNLFIDGGIANWSPIGVDSKNHSSKSIPGRTSADQPLLTVTCKALGSGMPTWIMTTTASLSKRLPRRMKVSRRFMEVCFGRMSLTRSSTPMAESMVMRSLRSSSYGTTMSSIKPGMSPTRGLRESSAQHGVCENF